MIFLVLKVQNLLQNLKVAVHMRVFCAQRIVHCALGGFNLQHNKNTWENSRRHFSD